MRSNKPPPETVLAHACELRACGSSWEVVAEAVHRSTETVRKWPSMYPELWQEALRDAERRLAAEAGGESLLILRQLLRSKDESIRCRAARALIHHHLELARLVLRAAALQSSFESNTEGQLLATLVESHTDEELAQLAARFIRSARILPRNPPQPPGGTG